jgi:hypothetical protein
VPIPDDIRGWPLGDMVLRAIADPAAIVKRERRPGGGFEPINDWRARAVWEVTFKCGVDPARTFVSPDAMRAFDEAEDDVGAAPSSDRRPAPARGECPYCMTSLEDQCPWHLSAASAHPDPEASA